MINRQSSLRKVLLNQAKTYKDIRTLVEPLLQYYRLSIGDMFLLLLLWRQRLTVQTCLLQQSEPFEDILAANKFVLYYSNLTANPTDLSVFRDILRHSHSIKELFLRHSTLNDDFFVNLQVFKFMAIERFTAMECEIGDQLSIRLMRADLLNLKSLTLFSDPISNRGLTKLVKVPLRQLLKLKLVNTNITGDALRLIGKGIFRLGRLGLPYHAAISFTSLLKVTFRLLIACQNQEQYILNLERDPEVSLTIDYFSFLGKQSTVFVPRQGYCRMNIVSFHPMKPEERTRIFGQKVWQQLRKEFLLKVSQSAIE